MKLIQYFILILIFFPSLSFATDLRGRIDVVHQYSSAPFPAREVQVDLFAQTPNGPILVISYLTGSDGMYYLQNVPPGNYMLVVNFSLQFPLVVLDMRLQDIAPVLLRY